MKKCEICGRKIADKKHMVTARTGRLFRRNTRHFHLDCFISDKIKIRDIVNSVTKS